MFFFSARLVRAVFSRTFYLAETMEQMYLIGVGSLYLVLLAGAFAGQGFAIAFSVELADFGAKNYLGRIMSIAIIRELGPTLTGLMIAARVAAGITAEIGAMRSSNQLDAMTAFGIDPLRKIGVPRLLALIVMTPALTIAADVIAIFGGYIVAIFVAKISTTIYWATVKERLIFGNIFHRCDQADRFLPLYRVHLLLQGVHGRRRHQGRRPRDHGVGGDFVHHHPDGELHHHQSRS